ncbi:zinc ribbon domain-containing protein [Deinococcus aquatilis]|uniref:double zinc ribbon domain-containing protein n=1 Tax=Deinococcus aquatilis TaxID=519440 RepID=UPI00146EE947
MKDLAKDDVALTPSDAALPLTYLLCPSCFRAVPSHSGAQYCVNDGTQLLTACPACSAAILSPYAHFCEQCGSAL